MPKSRQTLKPQASFRNSDCCKGDSETRQRKAHGARASAACQRCRAAQPPDLSTFDRNSARKIRIGRIEIEARVDLHGLRQDEAHAMLRAFLFRSQSRGLRYVLVITGKGKTTSISDRSSRDIERERGVLKRNVPRWLEEPDIRSIVVSYTTAAIHHGGEGAIYVHLRSKDRAGTSDTSTSWPRKACDPRSARIRQKHVS